MIKLILELVFIIIVFFTGLYIGGTQMEEVGYEKGFDDCNSEWVSKEFTYGSYLWCHNYHNQTLNEEQLEQCFNKTS